MSTLPAKSDSVELITIFIARLAVSANDCNLLMCTTMTMMLRETGLNERYSNVAAVFVVEILF